VLVLDQWLGFMSWRLAQTAKIAKIARTVASDKSTRTKMRWLAPAAAGGPFWPLRTRLNGLELNRRATRQLSE
jgi:hypothetical protein